MSHRFSRKILRWTHTFTVIRAVAFSLVSFTTWEAYTAPIGIPSWAKPVQAELPRVAPEIVDEVDDLWRILVRQSTDADTTKPTSEGYTVAMKRIVELREQSGEALVWQYLRDEPVTPSLKDSGAEESIEVRGGEREELLMQLSYDRELARWLLPLLRTRMGWMEEQLRRDPVVLSRSELIGIQVYFYRQGELSDIERLENIISVLAGSGIVLGDSEPRKTLQEQLPAIKLAKDRAGRLSNPFWRDAAVVLVDRGLLDESILKMSASTPNSTSETNVPRRAGEPDPMPPISTISMDATLWTIIVVLIVAGCGLLWLLLKRRS